MLMEPVEIRVTAADLVRQFGRWQQAAATRPVFVTNHGRDRLVLQSIADYAALRVGSHMPADGENGETLLDQMSEGYVAFDADLKVIAVNPPAAAYLRLPRGDAIGLSLFEEGRLLNRSLLAGNLRRALGSGAVTTFDTPSPCFPGRWLTVRTFPLHGRGAGCLLRDMTDDVVERREREEAAALRGAMAAHGGIGCARISPRGTLEAVDAGLAAMVGLPAATLVRARLIDIMPLARRRAAGDAIEAVLAGGGAVRLRTALLSNTGGEVPATIALAPMIEGGAIALATQDAAGGDQG